MWQTTGQPKAIALFEHSLRINNIAHAYLLTGPNHVGKTTLALDFARAVNCHGDRPPCSECQPCQRISSGKHVDVTIISLNATKGSKEARSRSEIGIDEIRALQRSVSLPPYEGKYKVFIIDGAECLSSEAANCLLKTLEEPPPRIVIFLLASEETRLLPTLVSRCHRVELKPIPVEEVEKTLVEFHCIDEHTAKLLSRLSQGCLGWALVALADENYLVQRDQNLRHMFSLLSCNLGERFIYAAQLTNDRKSAEELINLWLVWWRDVMVTKCACEQAVTNIDHTATLEKWAQMLNLQEVKDFIDSLQKSLIHISKNVNSRLIFEILMLDMPRKEERNGHTTHSLPVIP